jgi:hypothetical protein
MTTTFRAYRVERRQNGRRRLVSAFDVTTSSRSELGSVFGFEKCPFEEPTRTASEETKALFENRIVRIGPGAAISDFESPNLNSMDGKRDQPGIQP